MKRVMPSRALSYLFVLVGLGALAGCVDLNDGYSSPYGSPYGYDNGGYSSGGGYDDYYDNRERERNEEERRRLERERDRLDYERERLEREREREAHQQEHNRRPPPPAQDRCPAGFSPSENKCSSEERRHGCKDIRLPSGLGCVKR